MWSSSCRRVNKDSDLCNIDCRKLSVIPLLSHLVAKQNLNCCRSWQYNTPQGPLVPGLIISLTKCLMFQIQASNPLFYFQSIKIILGPSAGSMRRSTQCTKVRFASFLSGEFTTIAVIHPAERKLAKRTSVQCIILKIVGFHIFQPMMEEPTSWQRCDVIGWK